MFNSMFDEGYLQPKRASTMEFFCDYTIFTIKAPYRCSTGLYTGHPKYWNFQSEAEVEQIIAIVTTHSISCSYFYRYAI